MTDYMNKILLGDSKSLASSIPHNIVQTVVTSPPYWGLRHYSDNDNPFEIGREKTAEEYINNLVAVFSAIKPLLKDDGALWLNLGDSYKDKELVGIPWRVAIALQKDGWILRNDVIWHKQNAMPSSVKDRLTVDHEYMFFLQKRKIIFTMQMQLEKNI